MSNAFQVKTFIEGHIVAPGQTVLTALPLFHANAQLGTGLTIFSGGGHVLLATAGGYRTERLIEHFWEIIEHHRVASFSGVPTVYAGLLQSPRTGLDLSCLNSAICLSGPNIFPGYLNPGQNRDIWIDAAGPDGIRRRWGFIPSNLQVRIRALLNKSFITSLDSFPTDYLIT